MGEMALPCGKGAFSTVMGPSDGYEFSEREQTV